MCILLDAKLCADARDFCPGSEDKYLQARVQPVDYKHEQLSWVSHTLFTQSQIYTLLVFLTKILSHSWSCTEHHQIP